MNTQEQFLAEMRALLEADPVGGPMAILAVLHDIQRRALEDRQAKQAAVMEAQTLVQGLGSEEGA